jgi:hypothetical protein
LLICFVIVSITSSKRSCSCRISSFISDTPLKNEKLGVD